MIIWPNLPLRSSDLSSACFFFPTSKQQWILKWRGKSGSATRKSLGSRRFRLCSQCQHVSKLSEARICQHIKLFAIQQDSASNEERQGCSICFLALSWESSSDERFKVNLNMNTRNSQWAKENKHFEVWEQPMRRNKTKTKRTRIWKEESLKPSLVCASNSSYTPTAISSSLKGELAMSSEKYLRKTRISSESNGRRASWEVV